MRRSANSRCSFLPQEVDEAEKWGISGEMARDPYHHHHQVLSVTKGENETFLDHFEAMFGFHLIFNYLNSYNPRTPVGKFFSAEIDGP